MANQDTLYWIWLAQACGIESKQFGRLIEKIENPFDIYRLDDSEVEQLDGISSSLKIKLQKKNLDEAYAILKYCNHHKVDIISYGDKRYPYRLKDLEAPPIVLYCKGFFPNFNFNPPLCIGVVGTRKMSEYGKRSTYKISYELAAAGVLTVSGMALGIDAVSECATLAAKGTAIAVLGCGIDTVYPKQHKKLMEEIAKTGAVITEYPPKEPPAGYNFPRRNRIISGLSQGVFVAEAAAKSGALITARDAISQGRDVFALPGKISDENSNGPNELIKNGAYAAHSAWDIIKQYEFLYGDTFKTFREIDLDRLDADMNNVFKKYGLNYAIEADKGESHLAQAKRSGGERQRYESEDSAIQTTPKQSQAVDNSQSVLASLDEMTQRVFAEIPIDRPIHPDDIKQEGISVPELVTALTMLEINGLITPLPGGLYSRK